jgi:DNA modification methylase
MPEPANRLFYGDNLDILRAMVPDQSVDLVYLDPPFKSDQDYNVLFKEQDGSRSAAQIKAFTDTWRWDEAAVAAFDQAVASDGRVAAAMQAFHTFLGPSDMLAYLSMMAPRLVELRRVLKDTGSIYLHCDPTASHYLKMLMDAVFGAGNFKNEISWKRSHAHSSANRFGRIHDVILFYGKTRECLWNNVYQDYELEYVNKHYRHVDENGRRYKHENPTGAGVSNGETGKEWRGINPSLKGRHWVRPPSELEELDRQGKIHWPDKEGAWPYIKEYLDEKKGMIAQDVWTDIRVLNMMAKERLGYPTQKPLALLERIIQASSNPGDVVLDPFCGCGTTIDAAQGLGRSWLGIDITHVAIALIKARLKSAHGAGEGRDYLVRGEPADAAGAEALARADRFQFQSWAVGKVAGFPVEMRKGPDRGIDGVLHFRDDPKGRLRRVVISVKSGKTGPAHVRELRGVLEREKAAMGLLITLQEPTRKMKEDAAEAGLYASPMGSRHPKLQIRTVGELIAGQGLDYPGWASNETVKRAPKARRRQAESGRLFG